MTRLPQVRQQLLALHRALLAAERVRYEREHGRVSAGAFLELVVSAPQLAWLQPMTALIVALDEAAETAKSVTPEEARELEAAYLSDTRKLVAPQQDSEFGRKYGGALQDAPDVVIEHGALVRLLGANPN